VEFTTFLFGIFGFFWIFLEFMNLIEQCSTFSRQKRSVAETKNIWLKCLTQ
jgi:hypothetical protein